jgi:simple sugar transport system permease protein
VGIVLAALLFGMLKIGGLNISIASTTPPEIVDIVIAAVIFFVGANYLIRYLSVKLRRHPRQPEAVASDTQPEAAVAERAAQAEEEGEDTK